MINIKQRARELFVALKKDGFNGVSIDIDDETTDLPEEGEQTVEEKAEWDRNYAVFVVHVDFDHHFYDTKPYVEVTFHESDFWSDFKDMLQTTFGDVIINYYEGCHEFEIIRETK
jgi:hypothetical protein